MQYINPFELLNIQTENLSDIDSSTIRKAKNNLLADIELSDNKTIDFKGFELLKSDCIRIVDELDNNDKKEFHYFIAQNINLNLFLTKGDLTFFNKFKVESIYKLDDFIDFISPYYTKQYSKALSNNYRKQRIKNIKCLLLVKPIVNKNHIEDCYKSTYTIIQSIKNEIVQTAKKIDNNKSLHIDNDFKDLAEVLRKQVNVEILNLLPSYFQSIRNQIAQSIRSLSISINNTPFEIYKPAFEIISIAYNISTDGLVKQNITKGYFIIKGNYDKYSPKEITGSNKKRSSNDNNSAESLEVKFEAKVSSNSLELYEKFKVEFSTNVDIDVENYIPPSFDGFKIVSGPALGVSQSWVDGKSIYNKTFDYYLIPVRKGPLTIEAASIEFNGEIYKTAIIKINDPVISSQNNPSIDDNKEGSKSLYYWSFLCLTFAIGFFYNPVQKIILGISLLIWLITFFEVIKEKLFLKNYFSAKNLIHISCLVLGFFHPIIAQLFISYYFLIYFQLLITVGFSFKKKREKSKIGFYHYLIGSILVTFLYNNYDSSATNLFANESIHSEKELTDKQYFENGKSLFAESKFNEAINQFNNAISLNPNYAEAYGDRGASKQYLEQYKEAIDDYLIAEKLGLNTTFLYSNLGFSYYKLSDSDKALTYFEKSLELDEFNADALKYRGEIKYDRDDYSGAIEDFTKAIKIDSIASNYFDRGLAFYYLKDYKNALTDMNKAIELDPENAQYYYDRGDTKELMNDINAASIDWKTAKIKGYDVADYKIDKYVPQIVNVSNGELLGCNTLPRYNKKLNNKLVINVGSNASVAVKIINFKTDKCIRYVYINKNSEYSIRNIPEGIYYLKIAYGNDWSKIKDQPDCSGRFTKNTLFEKGEEILDFNLVHSGNSYKVPSFSLKLDVIISDDKMSTFNTDKINENDFYNE